MFEKYGIKNPSEPNQMNATWAQVELERAASNGNQAGFFYMKQWAHKNQISVDWSLCFNACKKSGFKSWKIAVACDFDEATKQSDVLARSAQTSLNILKRVWEHFPQSSSNQIGLIYAAVRGNQFPCIQFLVKHGVPVNDTRGQTKGKTPLHIAMKRLHLRSIEILLDLGADIRAKTIEGWTPLDLMAKSLDKPKPLEWVKFAPILHKISSIDHIQLSELTYTIEDPHLKVMFEALLISPNQKRGCFRFWNRF